MKVRELVEIMERVHEAKRDIEHAERAIGHGGSAETMRHKRETLEWNKTVLENLLDEDVPQ